MSLAHISEPLGSSLVRLDEVAARRQRLTVVETVAKAGGFAAPEEGTERCRMLEAALVARGTPFRSEGGKVVMGSWAMVRAAAVFATERDLIDVQQIGWGVTDQEARLALTQWGLTETKTRHAEPGDVLLFDMPDVDLGGGLTQKGGIHIAILSAAGGELSWAMLPGKTKEEPRIIHIYPARACAEAYCGKVWMDRLVGAWTFDNGRKTRPFALEAA